MFTTILSFLTAALKAIPKLTDWFTRRSNINKVDKWESNLNEKIDNSISDALDSANDDSSTDDGANGPSV